MRLALDDWLARGHVPADAELRVMAAELPAMARSAEANWRKMEEQLPDYAKLVEAHNPRWKARR